MDSRRWTADCLRTLLIQTRSNFRSGRTLRGPTDWSLGWASGIASPGLCLLSVWPITKTEERTSVFLPSCISLWSMLITDHSSSSKFSFIDKLAIQPCKIKYYQSNSGGWEMVKFRRQSSHTAKVKTAIFWVEIFTCLQITTRIDSVRIRSYEVEPNTMFWYFDRHRAPTPALKASTLPTTMLLV